MSTDPLVIGPGPRRVLALHGWFGSATAGDRSPTWSTATGTPTRSCTSGLAVGEHDPALSAAVVEQTFLQLHPDASLEVLADAGHHAVFETPLALPTRAERFLDVP